MSDAEDARMARLLALRMQEAEEDPYAGERMAFILRMERTMRQAQAREHVETFSNAMQEVVQAILISAAKLAEATLISAEKLAEALGGMWKEEDVSGEDRSSSGDDTAG